MVSKRCPNCGDRMEEFSPVTEEEWGQVKGQIPKHVRKAAVLRCTNGKCRRVQQRGNRHVGGNLPEPESD
ncbi:hypothetical protein [Streptomyces sp. NPDC059010]|uniref:hypothetical protein n=1 Tax=Streptomyces sp. NPDC059010 TaxID=3346695 RepID=UPI0036744368